MHVKAATFEDTFCVFLTMDHEIESLANLGVTGVDIGALGNCPICAQGPEGVMAWFRQGLQTNLTHGFAAVGDADYKRSIDMDAVTKANHFRKCAATTKEIPSNLTSAFADVEAEIRELEGDGRLSLKSYVDTDATDEDIRDCSSSLHCARPEAPAASGPCDVHGLVGGVCSHSFPLRGVFVDMHGPEQFVYYLVLLKFLVKAGCSIRDVYVDFACRLSVTWKRFIAKQGAQHFDSTQSNAASALRLLVNWISCLSTAC
jgi:hypothetical protein